MQGFLHASRDCVLHRLHGQHGSPKTSTANDAIPDNCDNGADDPNEGVISVNVFSDLVLMAVAATALAQPLAQLVLVPQSRFKGSPLP
jgi:hypothetical protein